jgi:hypothetical protein
MVTLVMVDAMVSRQLVIRGLRKNPSAKGDQKYCVLSLHDGSEEPAAEPTCGRT